MKRKNQQITFASIGTILFSLCIGYIYNSYSQIYQTFFILLIPIVCALFFIGIYLKRDKLYKIAILTVYFGLVILIVVTLIIKSNILKDIDSADDIIKLVNSFGSMGKFVFVVIQFLQVTFIPIPSTIVTGAGAAIYPQWEALLLSCTGLLIGSLFAFFLGKTFGTKLIKWLIGEEALNKYYKFIKGKDKAMLIYMFIFPVFPDDMLCLIAGLTSMNYVSFFIVQLISRPINVALTVFLVGNISLIPFSGIGILIWIAIVVFFILSMIFMWKYAPKIEYFMLTAIGKLIGKPLIKDIDKIVAEQFLIKRPTKKKIEDNENNSLEQDNYAKDVLASNFVTEKEMKNEEELNVIISNIIKKENKPLEF